MKNFKTVRFSFVSVVAAGIALASCGKVITLGGNSNSSISALLTDFPIVCKAYDLHPEVVPVGVATPGFGSMIPANATYLGSFSISHFNIPWMSDATGIPGTPDSFHQLITNFAISCEAQIVADSTGQYTFATVNDASTYVTIDGQLVNPFPSMGDPNYTQVGNVTLSAGRHTFRLEYIRYQHEMWETGANPHIAGMSHGPNELALQLYWGVPLAPSPSPTPSPSFSMPPMTCPGGGVWPTCLPTMTMSVGWPTILPGNMVIVPPSAFVAN
jgi:hypothetical protein